MVGAKVLPPFDEVSWESVDHRQVLKLGVADGVEGHINVIGQDGLADGGWRLL